MAKATLSIIKCGDVSVDGAVCYKGATPPYSDPANVDWKKLPCTVCLIEHPKGRILVDTSWDKGIRSNPAGVVGEILSQMFPGTLPEGEAADERLSAFGLAPEDIDYVVMTHLHCDHASGMKQLSGAKHFLVSDRELAAALSNPAHYNTAMWEGLDVEAFAFTDSEAGPLGKSFDLFGDGTVVLTCAPGHTPGQVAVIVGSSSEYVVLCGDAAYAPKSWEQMVPGGAAIDELLCMKSLEWLQACAKDPACKAVIANYDPGFVGKTIEVSLED